MYGGSEIRIEIDYGLEYMSKSLSLEEINLRNAFQNLVEARMAMGRYAFYSGSNFRREAYQVFNKKFGYDHGKNCIDQDAEISNTHA